MHDPLFGYSSKDTNNQFAEGNNSTASIDEDVNLLTLQKASSQFVWVCILNNHSELTRTLTGNWILEGGDTWSRFPSISFTMTLNAITAVLYKSVGGFLLRRLAPYMKPSWGYK